MEIRSHDEFKINNNHTAYYARKWLKQHPEHPKFYDGDARHVVTISISN